MEKRRLVFDWRHPTSYYTIGSLYLLVGENELEHFLLFDWLYEVNFGDYDYSVSFTNLFSFNIH